MNWYSRKHFTIPPFIILGLLLSFWGGPLAEAYIPKTRMILSRSLKNNGSSGYIVNQEVHFKTESQAMIVKETWIIEDGKTMRLTARGGNTPSNEWEYHVIFRGERRFILESDNQIHNYPKSSEFIEPYFHFRTLDHMLSQLIQINILPQDILSPQQPIYSLKQIKYEPEPYVRLSRTGGAIAYALGQPTPAGADTALPGVWIEQDTFYLKKLRFKSQAELSTNHYQRFAYGLKLPKDRILTWNNHSVLIRTLSATRITVGPKTHTQLNPQSLRSLIKKVSPERRAPENPLVKEFYARFR